MMSFLLSAHLFFQTGVGTPLPDTDYRPYLAGGIMLIKGPVSIDVPFASVSFKDAEPPRWFAGISVRMSVPIDRKKTNK